MGGLIVLVLLAAGLPEQVNCISVYYFDVISMKSLHITGYNSCIVSDKNYAIKLEKQGNYSVSRCNPPGVFNMTCGRTVIKVIQLGAVPLVITPSQTKFVGVYMKRITCTVRDADSNIKPYWIHVDGYPLFYTNGDYLTAKKYSVSWLHEGRYVCAYKHEGMIIYARTRIYQLYPEPQFDKSYHHVAIIRKLAKKFTNVPVFITYYELVPEQSLYVSEGKAKLQIPERRTEVAFQVCIFDYEIHGLTPAPSNGYTLQTLPELDLKVIVRPNVPVIFGDQESPIFTCEYPDNYYYDHVLEWRIDQASKEFRLGFDRGNKIVTSMNEEHLRSSLFHCYYRNKTVLSLTITYIWESTIIFTPDIDTINSSDPLTIRCKLRSTDLFTEFIKIRPMRKFYLDPFEIQNNTMTLKRIFHGEWTYKCYMECSLYKIEVTKTFKINRPIKIKIQPDQVIMPRNRLENISCILDPPEVTSHYQLFWTHVHGCMSHYVDPNNSAVLIPSPAVLPCTATYTCQVRGAQYKINKLHTIVVAHESLCMVSVSSPLVYVGEKVRLACRTIPPTNRTQVDGWYWPSYLQVTPEGSNTELVRHVTWHEQGVVDVHCYITGWTAILSRIYVLNPPKLSLADGETDVLIVGIGKFATCIATLDPATPIEYPRLPKWIKNSRYPDVEIHGNLLHFWKAPDSNEATFTCVYEHRQMKRTKEFTFKVYEMWQIVAAGSKSSNSVLQLDQTYQEACTPIGNLNKMKSVISSFSDLVVEQDANAHLKIDVRDNRVECMSPKKWACFTLTCNVFVNNIRLDPVRRTHCYIENGTVGFTPHPSTLTKGSSLTCKCTAKPKQYVRMDWSGKTDTGKEISIGASGDQGIIPPDVPGKKVTVTCKAYFFINGEKTAIGEATTSVQLTEAKVADLNYTNVDGLSPSETVTCPDSATIFMSDDAGWNGFTLLDSRSALVPKQVQVGAQLMGCEVRSASEWKRKVYKLPIIVPKPELHLSTDKVILSEEFRCYGIGSNSRHYRYKVRNMKNHTYGKFCPASNQKDGIMKFDPICPPGVQQIECTIYGDAQYGIPETSQVLEINLIAYDPILTGDDIILTPMPIRTILLFWLIWFCVLFFNALFMGYLINQNALYRLTQMQLMHTRRTGGTRINRRMENLPFIYIQRRFIDGEVFRRLRLITDHYKEFFELGDKWFLLWTMKKKKIRLKMLKKFREFLLGRGEERSRNAPSTYLRSSFWQGRSSHPTASKVRFSAQKET